CCTTVEITSKTRLFVPNARYYVLLQTAQITCRWRIIRQKYIADISLMFSF
ncbi:hypothetical protein, partial [Salmonella enterica subsp. enterica serovar Enteritidis]